MEPDSELSEDTDGSGDILDEEGNKCSNVCDNGKILLGDSKKLVIYAKLLNFLDDKIMKLNRKQELKKVTK